MPRSYVKKTAARALKGKSQVLSSNNDVEYIVDEFDTSLSINIETDICVFCKRGQEEGIRLREKSHFQDIPVDLDGEELNPDDIDDWMLTYRNAGQKKQYSIDQIWISKYSIHYTGRKVFAHFICAYFSPLVWYDGIAWKNVRREYIRGQSLSCKLCGLKGATLRCIDKKCHSCFHIPCAIEIGFGGGTHGIMKTDKFMCIEHKQQQLAEKQQLDRVASKDISRGQESTPIYVKNTVDTSQPQQFHYITNNCDSDDAIATSQNFSQIACCDCTGLCNDIQTCACIQIQRNYTNFEVLIAGNSNPILECNLRCACSMRRCTNRVVGRGKYL